MPASSPILKWASVSLAILGLIVALGTGVLTVRSWRATARLEQRLSAVRDSGDPATLDDLREVRVAPNHNAVERLRRIRPDIEAIEKLFRDKLYTTESYRRGDYSPEDDQLIAATLSSYPGVIETITAAADCPRFALQIPPTIGPPKVVEWISEAALQVRSVARVMKEQIHLDVSQGDRERALQRSIQLLRLTRKAAEMPSLVGFQAVAASRWIAIETTSHVILAGPVSGELREALDRELASQDEMSALITCLKSERAFCNSSFLHLWSGTLGAKLLMSPRFTDEILLINNFFDREIGYGTASAFELDAMAAPPPIATANTPFLGSIEPAIRSARQAMNRLRATLRCLRVLNSLQERASEWGESPGSAVSELGLPRDATIDPFTGTELLVRHSALGWTVYSVGPNLADDEGWLDSEHDVGVGVNQKAIVQDQE